MGSALFLLLVLQAGSTLASPVDLAPGLKLSVPDSLVVEVLDAPSANSGPVVVGAVEGEPGYFIAATRAPDWERNQTLWKQLELELRHRSEEKVVNLGAEGRFATLEGDSVWYRTYEWRADGRPQRHVYFLLKGERSVYWFTLTMVEGVEVGLALPLAEALIRRASIDE